MSDPIQMICDLANCSKEEAETSYNETNDVVESVDKLLAKSSPNKYIPVVKRSSEAKDSMLQKSEDVMKYMSRKNHHNFISKDPLVSSSDSEKKHHLEQMVPQSNCVQECLLPSLESTE
jgi:hypothetical protein